MTPPPSPRRKPSWKDAAGARADTGRRADWQAKGAVDKPVSGRPWWLGRRALMCYVLSGLGALAGAIVCVILWLSPTNPMRLVLIGADTKDNLAVPPNLYAQNSLDALNEWAREHNATTDSGNQVEVKRVFLADDDDAVVKPLRSEWVPRRKPAPLSWSSYLGALRPGLDGGRPRTVPCLLRPDHLYGKD